MVGHYNAFIQIGVGIDNGNLQQAMFNDSADIIQYYCFILNFAEFSHVILGADRHKIDSR